MTMSTPSKNSRILKSHQANSAGRKQQPNAVNNVVKRLSMSHFCKILPTINTRSGGVTRQYLTFPKST